MLRHDCQDIYKDLGFDLNADYLASIGSSLFCKSFKPVSGRLAHLRLGMMHPDRLARPAWTVTFPLDKSGLKILCDPVISGGS